MATQQMSQTEHLRGIVGHLKRAVGHLRLYESGQVLAPGFFGIVRQGSVPDLSLLLLYAVAYASHVLSIYSYNDLSDYHSDADNPRKADHQTKSTRWLQIQTLLLLVVFAATAPLLPLCVASLFVGNQILCMAYSHPRIRLKGRILGSEFAHFVAGMSYFISGVLLTGGDAYDHLLGGIVFGLLYLSGGTFNEVMDCEADRNASLRHLVVVIGKRSALWLVIGTHYACFVLLALYEPTVVVIGSCAAAAMFYTTTLSSALTLKAELLLQFRGRYRILFAGLLLILVLTEIVATDKEILAPTATEAASVTMKQTRQ